MAHHLSSPKHRVKRRKPRRKPGRLLYRSDVSADELDRLIDEVGLDSLVAALGRRAQPALFAVE
jgi:hypothetical protein